MQVLQGARGYYTYIDPLKRRFYYDPVEDTWFSMNMITLMTQALEESDHFQRIELKERAWREGQLRGHPFLAPDGEYWCFSKLIAGKSECWEKWQKEAEQWEKRGIPNEHHGLRLDGRMAKTKKDAEDMVVHGHYQLRACVT